MKRAIMTGGLAVLGVVADIAQTNKSIDVEVLPPESNNPPKISLKTTPFGGGPDHYDFEDGTQCVVRSATNRKCKLSWEAEKADNLSLDQGIGSVSNFNGMTVIGPDGPPSQFPSGEIRTYTLTAKNKHGQSTASVQIRRYSCFLAGTQVLMADGAHKNIEDIRRGDQVMSYDLQKQQFVGKSVIGTTERISEDYFIVNGNMNVTAAHVIYANGDWKKVGELSEGDLLMNANGERVAITSLEKVAREVAVYNLITEYPENFFAENILVHNQKKGRQIPGKGLLAGTRIALADGRLVPVEKVRVGDRLIAYDSIKRRYVLIGVHGTSNQKAGEYLVINGKLNLGVQHPIYQVSKEAAEGPGALPD